MSKSKHSKTNSPLPLVANPFPPDAPDKLPDIDGGEENLLPISVLSSPLRIVVPMWLNSNPSPTNPESISVLWDGVEFADKRWTAPVPADDLIFYAPETGFSEGEHQVKYEVTLSNGDTFPSDILTLTIDRTRPRLNQSDERLIFPDEIIRDGVTAAYLAANNNQVKATIPLYDQNSTGPKPGDIITWYLNEKTGVDEPDQLRVGSLTVPYPVPATLEAVYPGQAFVDFGDRAGFARYRIEDRAGNLSDLATKVDLEIKAAPIPRDLTYPRVNEASGSPQASQLDPNPSAVVLNGVLVTIPQNALISDAETAAVLFGEPGSFGFYRAEAPTTTGGREYRIPKDYVARNVRKTIPVSFAVTVPSLPNPLPSAVHNLTISSLTGLPTIQCDKVAGSGGSATLRLSTINDGGVATFTQATWKYMATWQFFRVTVRGVLTAGGSETVTVLDAGPVPASGTVQGGTITKTILQRFKRGETLDIRSYVSFDNKASWYDFPYVSPTLLD